MANPLNWLSQLASVTRLNLVTLWNRRGSTAAAVFGIAGVVAALVGVLSIAQGFKRTMETAGSPDVVIVMRGGSSSEMLSFFGRESVRIIQEAPQIARTEQGPVASAELYVIINLPKRSTGTDANVPLRGVQSRAFEVRKDFRIIQGRPFEWGRNEVIVGLGAAREFAGLDLGAHLTLGKTEWKVVGIFSASDGIAESEIWTDVKVLQPAYQRGTSFQSVYARLKGEDAFQAFKDALTTDPRVSVMVRRETEYYAEQSSLIINLVTRLGILVAGLMGIGAVFGALNTMYTAVSSRTREIATLRALGFRGGPVVLSVMLEALVLATVGGLIGGGLAYAAFDEYRTATLNFQSFSQVAFAFDVTPALLVQGIVYALIIGLIGGFFPALRAARLPVARALREL